MFSNSRSLSFLIPFVAVTFIYHFVPACTSTPSNLVTELLPGVLAGFTSLALYSAIKALKHKVKEAAAPPKDKDTPITVEHLEKADSVASNELKNLESESVPLGKRES
jgi:hypothetical protein